MPAPTNDKGTERFDREQTPVQLERFIAWRYFKNVLDDQVVHRSARSLAREMVRADGWNGPCYSGNAIGFAIRAMRAQDPKAARIPYEPMFTYERWSDNNNATTWCITPKPEYRLGVHYYDPLPKGRLKI